MTQMNSMRVLVWPAAYALKLVLRNPVLSARVGGILSRFPTLYAFAIRLAIRVGALPSLAPHGAARRTTASALTPRASLIEARC